VGYSTRENDYHFWNDTLTTEGRSFLDQALGLYPAQNSVGYIEAKEVYGEVLIPVLSDLPLIKRIDLELGGRRSEYSTTGASYTYKALADWRVFDWMRVRGGYNRAERAPNMAELGPGA
jgi:outer membrane receptor protein involved in Fe transport